MPAVTDVTAALKVVPYEGLEHLPPGYGDLFARAGAGSVFLDLSWFRNLARTVLGDRDRVVAYGFERAGHGPIGMLVTRHGRRGQRLGSVRVIEGLANYYSSYYAPVLDPADGEVAAVCRALANALGQARRTWDVIDLKPLDPESKTFVTLVEALRTIGAVQTYFCFGNWYLRVAGRSFDQYRSSLPSLLRETIRRKGKKLESSHGGRVEIITGFDGLDAAIQAYQQVYQESWKQPEPYPDFIPGLIKTWAELGYLRLGIVRIGAQPVAAQLWAVRGRAAYIFKLAYDERFAKLSAGTVLTSRLLQHVIDVDRVEEVDYLTGDDAYKKDWMSHRRDRWGILVFNRRSVRGQLHGLRHVGGRAVKRMIDRLRQPDARPGRQANPEPLA
jgi:CelD/BcsL family acetyltransferase involved in cellulose biosynthesis